MKRRGLALAFVGALPLLCGTASRHRINADSFKRLQVGMTVPEVEDLFNARLGDYSSGPLRYGELPAWGTWLGGGWAQHHTPPAGGRFVSPKRARWNLDGPQMKSVIPRLVDQIHDLLRGMGGTAAAVAEVLRTGRIRGRPDGASFDNPIVRYLYQNLNIGRRLTIPAEADKVLLLAEGQEVTILLPAAVADFLEQFAHGAFPDLQER